MKQLIILMVIFSATLLHAGEQKEVRILNDIELTPVKSWVGDSWGVIFNEYELKKFIPSRPVACTLRIRSKVTTKIEAGTIFASTKVEIKDFIMAEIPFANKSTQTEITFSSENKDLSTRIECTVLKAHIRRAAALKEKVDLDEALVIFSTLLN